MSQTAPILETQPTQPILAPVDQISDTNSNKVVNIAIIVVMGIIILLLIIIAFVLIGNRSNSTLGTSITIPQPTKTQTVPAVINGTFAIEGYIPSGASISIGERLTGQTTFTTIATNLAANQGSTWSWANAISGTSYDIQASLLVNGVVQGTSQILTVDAPAQNEVLNINSTIPAPAVITTITGSVAVSGYIPQGTTINVEEKQPTEAQYGPVASGLAPTNGISWSFPTAIQGKTYEIRARLLQGGVELGSSQKVVVVAPAQNQILGITSTATAPAPAQVSISGNWNLNGSIPSGSTLSLGTRLTGSGGFNTVSNNITPADNSNWSWNGATSGVSYDVQATLLSSSGSTIAQSQIVTVTAPSTSNTLTINAPQQPTQPPANSITNTCVGNNPSNNGLWQVQFNFNTNNAVSNAQQYQLTVGTNTGGNQVYSVTNAPANINSSNQTQTVTTGFLFTSGQTYYAQWAYATSPTGTNFSPFSQSLTFYCTTPN